MEPVCETDMKSTVFHSTWVIKAFSTIQVHSYSSAMFSGHSPYTSCPVSWRFTLLPKECNNRTKIQSTMGTENISSSMIYADIEIELNTPAIADPKTTGIIGFPVKRLGGDMDINRAELDRYLLKNDTLTLRFKITLHEIVSNIQKPLQILDKDSQLLDNYASLFTSNEYFSDLTVIIGDKEFPVHRAILAVRSPVFAAMFKHTEMMESQQKQVIIKDIESHVFQEVLRFIYTDTVQGLDKIAHKLLAAADKYALDRLRNMCEEYLGQNLSVESVMKTLHLADLYHAKQLRQLAVQFIAQNIKAMQTNDWKNLLTNNPDVAAEMFSELTKQR